MRIWITLSLLIGILGLTGCNYSTRGGILELSETTVTESLDNLGNPVKTTTTKNTKVQQPENPSESAEIQQTESGIKITTGGSYNSVEISGRLNLLNAPIYAGTGLVIIAGISFLITKSWKWSLVLGATGVAMIAGSYLLAAYAQYFLLGLVAVLAFGGYLLYDYLRQQRANEENVKVIQTAKVMDVIDGEAFGKIADELQSGSTQKVVKKIKGK